MESDRVHPRLTATFALVKFKPFYEIALTLKNEGGAAAVCPTVLLSKRPSERQMDWPLVSAGLSFKGTAVGRGEILYEPVEATAVLAPGMAEVVAVGRAGFGAEGRSLGLDEFAFPFAVTLSAREAEPVSGAGMLVAEGIDWNDPRLEMPRLVLPPGQV